jgi:hypothetical protein
MKYFYRNKVREVEMKGGGKRHIVHKSFRWKHEGEKLLGRPRHGWEDNVRTYFNLLKPSGNFIYDQV